MGEGRTTISRLRENLDIHKTSLEPSRIAQMPQQLQDAQKGRPARPQRVTGDCHLSAWWLSPSDSGTGTGQCRSQSLEDLNDARTPLADIFSILLDGVIGKA